MAWLLLSVWVHSICFCGMLSMKMHMFVYDTFEAKKKKLTPSFFRSALFVPAVFSHSEGSDSRPLLHPPHLQDSPAGGVDDQEQSVASGKRGGRGELPITSLLWNLQPTQLSVSVTCNSHIYRGHVKLLSRGYETSIGLLSLLSSHLSTCGWRCLWPSPAVWLDQSHPSLQPACCRGTDRWTRHGDENLGDQIWTEEVRFKKKDDRGTSASFILPTSIRHTRGVEPCVVPDPQGRGRLHLGLLFLNSLLFTLVLVPT